MKRNIFVGVVVLLFLALSVMRSQAAPLFYTFEGEITYAADNGSGLLGPLSVGDPLTYTFQIDTGSQGSFTTFSGSTTVLPDSTGWSYVGYDYKWTDYIKTDYVAGSVLTNASPGFFENTCPSCTGEYNYGVQYYHYYYPDSYDFFRLFGESEDEKIEISSWGRIQDQLVEGATGFYLEDRAYGSSYQYAEIKGSLTLETISDTYPSKVPEPSGLLLLGVGLAGLTILRKRNNHLFDINVLKS